MWARNKSEHAHVYIPKLGGVRRGKNRFCKVINKGNICNVPNVGLARYTLASRGPSKTFTHALCVAEDKSACFVHPDWQLAGLDNMSITTYKTTTIYKTPQ